MMNYEKIKTPKALYNSWKMSDEEKTKRIKEMEKKAEKDFNHLGTLEINENVRVKWLLDVAPKSRGDISELSVPDATQMVKLFKAEVVKSSKTTTP